MNSQLEADFQQAELQMDDQEPPDDTGGPAPGRSDQSFPIESLQNAAQLFLSAQQDATADLSFGFSAHADPRPSGQDHGLESDPATGPHTRATALALPRKASDGARSTKHKWSLQETQALVDGCNKHGVGNWKRILSDPELCQQFSDRSAGDLKDRFRTYFPDTYHELYPNAKTHLSKAVRGKDAKGKSIFEKGKAKERRPFSAEEDAALKRGYLEHGSHWALIAKDPAFESQRRAIDLRDRFRNAFPEDYERAGFKPRLTKCKKERPPGDGRAADDEPPSSLRAAFPLTAAAEGGASFDGGHAEYSMSDASDGHLTDHGNLTDGNEHLLGGRPARDAGGALLTRSSSLGSAFRGSHSKLQQSTTGTDDTGTQPPLPQRPQYVSANTMPLPYGLADTAHNRKSVGSLFEQLRKASVNSTATQSEASSIHGRNTPPSEGDLPPISHAKAASAEESRCHAGKPKDAASHKRRSHSTRTGKSSALERMPSVHSHGHAHIHGHGHGHGHHQNLAPGQVYGHDQSQPSSGNSSERPPLAHLASNASSSSEASWMGYDRSSSHLGHRPDSQASNPHKVAVAMDVDDPLPMPVPMPTGNFWLGQQSTPSDVSAASLNTPRSSVYSQIDYPNLQMWSHEVAGQTGQMGRSQLDEQSVSPCNHSLPEALPRQPEGQLARGQPTGSPTDHCDPTQAEGGRAADGGGASVGVRGIDSGTGSGGNSSGIAIPQAAATASRGVWFTAMDASLDPLQDLLDPLGPPGTTSGSGWANGWSFNANGQGRSADAVGGALSSTPLSHHKWAGDLHLRNYSVNNLNALFDSMSDFASDPNISAERADSGQHSVASSLHSRSASNFEASPAVSETSARPQSSADEERGRMMSLEPQERQRGAESGSASWSPVRRETATHGSFGIGQAATNPCPTPPPPTDAAPQAGARRLSDPASRSVQDLLEAASFNLDATLGLDSSAFFPSLAETGFDLRRKRSNDTLRNTDGIIGSDAAPAFASTDSAPDLQRPQLFNGERRNSVPAAAMLSQGTAEYFARGSGEGSGEGSGAPATAGLADASSISMLSGLQQLDLLSTAVDSPYAASLPDVSASSSAAFAAEARVASQQQHHQHQQAQTQQMYSYDDIDLAALADLDRSPARLYAEAQELFNQLEQANPPWSTSGLAASIDRPAQPRTATLEHTQQAQSASSHRETAFSSAPFAPGSQQDGEQTASGWPRLGDAPAVDTLVALASPAAARSASVSYLGQRPQILRGFLSNDAASTTITPSTLLNSFTHDGAPLNSNATNAASLWASSGSLDRLEHLYLEGLHSSPSLAAASPMGSNHNSSNVNGHGSGGGGGGPRSGWLLSGANEFGTGYLSE